MTKRREAGDSEKATGSDATPGALLIEPDEGLGRRVSAVLLRAGFEPVRVRDHAAALVAFAARRPDLIVYDHGLWGSDREDFALRASRMLGAAPVPVVVLGSQAAGEPGLFGDTSLEVRLDVPFADDDLMDAIATARWMQPLRGGRPPKPTERNPAVRVVCKTTQPSALTRHEGLPPESGPPSSAPRSDSAVKVTRTSPATPRAKKQVAGRTDSPACAGPEPRRSAAEPRPLPPQSGARAPPRSGQPPARGGGPSKGPRKKRFKSTLSFSASRVVTVSSAAHGLPLAEAVTAPPETARPAPTTPPRTPAPAGSRDRRGRWRPTRLDSPRSKAQSDPPGEWERSSSAINVKAAQVRRDRHASTFLTKHTVIAERYRVLGILGSGGMATVYRVRDQELDEDVALKLLKVDKSDAEGQDRFRQEMRICRRLQHPNIVHTYEFGVWEGRRFLTMELMEGRDLAELLLMRKGPMEVGHGIDLLIQACAGLGAAHDAGVIHRDVKPHNLFVTRGEQSLKVMDFGIAKTDDVSLTVTSGEQVLGTPAYLAPERLKDKVELSTQTDLYSMGVVMYQVFTGHLPFVAPDISSLLTSIVLEEPAPPRELNGDIPDALQELILRLMHKRPERRYLSCAEVVTDLRRIRAGG